MPTEPAEPAPREKLQPKDARAFQPSSFASRAAVTRHHPTEQRLVSLGGSEFRQRTRDGGVEILEVEMFFDRDKPMDRYARFPGHQVLTPLQDNSRQTEEVTALPPIRGRKLHRPDSSAFEPALPDQPPRLIT